MDLFFLTSSVFGSQEGSQRGLGYVRSLSLSEGWWSARERLYRNRGLLFFFLHPPYFFLTD